MRPRATVVIPVFNRVELTRMCLDALAADGLDGVEVIVVDNGSGDDTPALLVETGDAVRSIRNRSNLGFATACNQGAHAAQAQVVVFLNNDTEVRAGWLDPLLAALEDPAVGVTGSRLLYPNGRVQHAGMALMPGCAATHLHRGAPGDHPAVTRTRDLSLVTGACLGVRRQDFLDAGAFDTAFRNGYEDVDLCLRLRRRGLVARQCGDSVVVHHESMTPGRSATEQDNALLFRRRWWRAPSDWAELLAEDGAGPAGPGDVRLSGPLFDGSPSAAELRARIVSLDGDGARPMVSESPVRPAAPGAPCPDAVLRALNRVEPIGPDRTPAGEVMPTALGWWGPVHGRSGYATAARGVIGAASRAGLVVRVQAADVGHNGVAPPGVGSLIQVDPDLWVVHHLPVGPDGIAYWRELGIAFGRRLVGATCFETEGIPAPWVEAARDVAEVWVPTAFNLRTFAAAGVDPGRLHAVPYPVDTALFAPDGRARDDAGPTVFCSVFEWTWRKGWDALLRAWVEEFDPSEAVRLRVLTYRGAGALGEGDVVEQAMGFLADMGRSPEDIPDIELILDPVDTAGLIELYRSSDAFVLPTRGEGAGMPILEAMACGTPVIATERGGHEELMDPELALPVAVDRLVDAPAALVDDNPLYAGQRLAEPSVASLRAALRSVHEDRGAARARAVVARAAVAERFGPETAARAVERRVAALLRPRTPAPARRPRAVTA